MALKKDLGFDELENSQELMKNSGGLEDDGKGDE